MKLSRRDLLHLMSWGAITPLVSKLGFDQDLYHLRKRKENQPAKELKILILGGTSFLGPHQVAYALRRGHTVSTFTRGKTLPTIHQNMFDRVERLIGDRKDNLSALENRSWDVVIDNSGRDARWTNDTAKLLKDNCDLYVYTSSTGVYYPYAKSERTEDSKLLLKEPEGIVDEGMKLEYGYGVMKANSELKATEHFGEDRTLIIRPTYMIGPADKTNRFIHWPLRLSKGGEILVPGRMNDVVQYTDVRDVAEWMIRMAENGQSGIYNAVGPKQEQSMTAFVKEAQGAFDVESELILVDDYDFLKSHNIHYIVPWIMQEGNNKGTASVSNQKAIENGLIFRPIVETVQSTFDWWHSDGLSQEKRDAYELDVSTILFREQSIIESWKKR